MNQGYLFAAARAFKAAANATNAADTRAALRGLDQALHAHRIVAERVERARTRRATAGLETGAMLRALRTTRERKRATRGQPVGVVMGLSDHLPYADADRSGSSAMTRRAGRSASR